MKKILCILACTVGLSTTALANESAVVLQEAFVAGLLANDPQALADCYADDAINFPLSSMVGHGPDSVAESWAGFFSKFRIIAAELSDGHLETHGDTAIAWGFFNLVAEPRDGGEAVKFVGRYMDVARNIDGSWLYVADHASMPFPSAEE